MLERSAKLRDPGANLERLFAAPLELLETVLGRAKSHKIFAKAKHAKDQVDYFMHGSGKKKGKKKTKKKKKKGKKGSAEGGGQRMKKTTGKEPSRSEL